MRVFSFLACLSLLCATACNSGDARSCPPGDTTCSLGTVTFNLLVSGPGSVTLDGTPCAAGTCSQTVVLGQSVALAATPEPSGLFAGWSGDCTGTQPEVSIALDAPKSCTANFVTQAELVLGSDGRGAVIGGGVSCDEGTCTRYFPEGTEVSLRAQALPGFRFSRWSGTDLCADATSPEITVVVSGSVRCVAEFRRRLTVTGLASGATAAIEAKTTNDPNSSCANNRCEVDAGGVVTLTAPTVSGYYVSGWSGAGCSGAQGAALTVTTNDADLTCTATYAQGIAIIGSVVGAPVGTQVTAESGTQGADCTSQPGACRVPPGATVTLSAPAVPGHRFTGWSGDTGCTGTGGLTFTNVQTSKTCSATYVQRVTVTVALQNGVTPGAPGVGATTGAPVCDADSCEVDSGTSVNYTAQAVAGQVFVGWSGASCPVVGESNTPALTISQTVSSNRTCTASYLTTLQARAPDLVNPWITPTGWITAGGAGIQMTFSTANRATNTIWQCRTGRTAGTAPAGSLVTAQTFTACASPSTTASYIGKKITGDPNGAYRTDVRIKFMSYISLPTLHTYYAHDSLDGAALCAQSPTDDEIFAVARPALGDPSPTFVAGQKPVAPRVKIIFDKNQWNTWAVKATSGGTDPAVQSTFDRLSLRHAFHFSSDNRLLLMRRLYEGKRPKAVGAAGKCTNTTRLGWRSFKWGRSRNNPDPKRALFRCEAFVMRWDGVGVCVTKSPTGQPVVVSGDAGPNPAWSIAMWNKAMDDDRFSAKSTTGPCGAGCIYLPD